MKFKLIVLALLLVLPLGQAFAQDAAETGIDATKNYLIANGAALQEAVDAIQADAQAYYDIISEADFDYQTAWAASAEEIIRRATHAREQFILAHNAYESIEGIVAGVPTLADFDVWIDAGPTGEEDPEGAYVWTLTLPDGREFENPGNIFHWLLETTLWGTQEDHTGARVDFDSNGTDERGDALPEANFFLGIANAFVDASTQLNESIAAWEPSLEDSFTALVTMIPTMGDYFQEWKNSAFVAGDDPRFVAQSRLIDVKGIASSLSVIYSNVAPEVAGVDATLNEQIDAGFVDLLSFLDETHQQELDGVQFTAEQADALGEQAQVKADTLAALAGQAASLLNLTLAVE